MDTKLLDQDDLPEDERPDDNPEALRWEENRRGPTSSAPSKSRKKREVEALQSLGVQLVALSTDRLKKIALPDHLREAVREAQRITSHGAKRRQFQLIGKLMREIDPAPIQEALDEINGVSAAATARLHALEKLRQRLLEDETVLGQIAADHPGVDMQQLRQLRRNALKEQEQGKPPKAFREIFRILKELQSQGASAEDEELTDDDQ
ncbi:ribosome biogenesis factor YjgA [Denitratisoma sp. agr-D3]